MNMLYTDCIQDFEEKRKETIELSMIPDLREEHETGFEPATLALARRYSTTEPLVQNLLFCRCISDNTYDTGKRYICQQIFFIFQILEKSSNKCKTLLAKHHFIILHNSVCVLLVNLHRLPLFSFCSLLILLFLCQSCHFFLE